MIGKHVLLFSLESLQTLLQDSAENLKRESEGVIQLYDYHNNYYYIYNYFNYYY